MTVLILAQELDRTADHVVRALQDREAQVARFDVSWFPQQLDLDAELQDGQWVGQLRTAYRVVDLQEIRSIWYRSPAIFAYRRACQDRSEGMRTGRRRSAWAVFSARFQCCG